MSQREQDSRPFESWTRNSRGPTGAMLRAAKLVVEVRKQPLEFADAREFLVTLDDYLKDLCRAFGIEPDEMPDAWCR